MAAIWSKDSRRSLLAVRVGPEKFPEASRRHDWKGCPCRDAEQVLIASHKDIGVPGERFGEHQEICGIAEPDVERWGIRDDEGLAPQESVHLGDGLRGNSNFLPENASQFAQDSIAHHQLMFRKYGMKDVSAETAGRDRADQYVGVKKDLHDTSRKTSSSVR